ncbi:hypothetical protein IAD21_00588 [Abditibacteriota bacterium]|nr:hypothetical protein IAD21_00588 [Abditibacteriota bacterium]
MSKPFKAKLFVESVQTIYLPNGEKQGERVILRPVYSNDPQSENYSFSKFTPQGNVELTITNPELWGNVEGIFTLDFRPVESREPYVGNGYE